MSLKDVLIDELRDMYCAENQLVERCLSWPRALKTRSESSSFLPSRGNQGPGGTPEEDLCGTGRKAHRQHCNGMEGVIEEGKDALEKDEEGASFDAGLIGAELRTERYEIAGYEACISMATSLGLTRVVKPLNANLKEELAAAKKITAAGGPILKQSDQEPEAPKKPESGKEKYSAKKSKEDEAEAAPSL